MKENQARDGKVSVPSADRSGSVWPVTLLALFLLAIVLITHWRVLTGQETFFLRDLGTTHRPAAILFLRLGFAHTNPFASFGQPYLGNPNLLVAYPFPKSAGIGVEIIFHLGFCFAGLFALLRRMKTSLEGSFLAASAFSLSGYVLSATASLNAITTIAWIPWILLTGYISGERPMVWRRIALSVVVLGVSSLAGEPVLFGIALLLGAVLAIARGGSRAIVTFGLCGVAAALLTFPVHAATFAAAMDSARVRLGFTFANAASASFHPARLVEIVAPYFFGNPSRLVGGAWWGYAVSGGMPPYIYSAAFSLIGLLLVLIFGVATGFRTERFWWLTAVVSFGLSVAGYLPGAEWVYRTVTPLHAIRFPIKFYLFSTLALAILCGRAFDYLAEMSPRLRKRAVYALLLMSLGAIVTAFEVQQNGASLVRALVRGLWSPGWRMPPDTVLTPFIESLPGRLVIVAAMVFALLLWIGRRRGSFGHALLLLIVIADLAVTAGPLLPTVPTAVVRQRSPLAAMATGLKGPIFERTEKDLEPVIFGIKGRYTTDDVRELASVQARQAWALSGVSSGIRYAFDPCPDGSYTMRNQRIEDLLADAEWSRRLKWLRAAGVAGVISSSIPRDMIALRLVYQESSEQTGIPTALYAIADPLPEVRRAHRIVIASSMADAVVKFERADFDPRDAIVIETSHPPRSLDGGRGTARILRETADKIDVETVGEADSMVFLARSFTSRLGARVNGLKASVFPANVHLIAIPVPAGRSIVTVAMH